MRNHNDKASLIVLQIDFSSTIFSKFVPLPLVFISELEEMARCKRFGSNEEIIAKTKTYFEGFKKSGRHRNIEESFDKVYRAKRRLLESKLNFIKNVVFLHRPITFQSPLVYLYKYTGYEYKIHLISN